MGNDRGKGIGQIILIIFVAFLLIQVFSGGHFGPVAWLMHLVSFLFWTGIVIGVIVLAITGAVIWFTVRDNKYRGKHDPPNVTPQAAKEAAKKAAGKAWQKVKETSVSPEKKDQDVVYQETAKPANEASAADNTRIADRSKTYDKTPEGVQQMLTDYQIDCILGPVAADALKQKERLEAQQKSYQRLVVRRFGKGTLSAEKYLSVEKSSNDALQNTFLKIANRMEAFDTKEYLHFTSGAYKYDSIPDHVQEQRHELYRENLRYMKECLAENEHILAGMDRLMLKLADSDSFDEHSITEEIEELERQLAYYKRQR